MTFSDEIRKREKQMAAYFDLSDKVRADGDEERSNRYREQAMLVGDFIKTLEELEWDYT